MTHAWREFPGLLIFISILQLTSEQKNLCDTYWYSLDNPAVVECRDMIRITGRMATDTTLAILQSKSKLSPSDGTVEVIINLDLKFVECVLEQDDKVLPVDTIILQQDQRTYTGNKFIMELVSACKERIENACPFNDVFNDDDKKASNCVPHPLKLLKCVRQIGIPACYPRAQEMRGDGRGLPMIEKLKKKPRQAKKLKF